MRNRLLSTALSMLWLTASVLAWTGDDGSTLFADGFEDCFDNWTNGGAYCSNVHYEGLHSCKMDNNEYVETTVDTTGYSNVVLNYVRSTSDLNSGDSFYSEWYDGYSWTTIEEITSGFSDWTEVSFALPAGAGDNSAFTIRFRVSSGTSNYAYVDSVNLVPEPCSLVLFSLGGLLLRRRKK